MCFLGDFTQRERSSGSLMEGLLGWAKGCEGKVMIILCSSSFFFHLTHTLCRSPSHPLPSFSGWCLCRWGSRRRFLPGLLIALQASSCNGLTLSNAERQPALCVGLKITLLIPLFLSVSLSHFHTFFMAHRHFLTVTCRCFPPLG